MFFYSHYLEKKVITAPYLNSVFFFRINLKTFSFQSDLFEVLPQEILSWLDKNFLMGLTTHFVKLYL